MRTSAFPTLQKLYLLQARRSDAFSKLTNFENIRLDFQIGKSTHKRGLARPIHDEHGVLGFWREPTVRRGSPFGVFAA